jgi:hypothetical protein
MKIQISKAQKIKFFKALYAINFIAFFPLLWFSFLYLAIQQLVMIALLWGSFSQKSKKERRKEDPIAKFPMGTVLLFFFHLLVLIGSLIIYFVAKQNSDGSYRL